MNRKAIVTLVIGQFYIEQWTRLFKATWEAYAKKHGYDIIVIEDYIDQTPRAKERAPHWQKCLILEHPQVQGYDQVVWLDADILINYHQAPCIASQVPAGQIGGVSFMQSVGNHPRLAANRWERGFRLMQYLQQGDPWGLGRMPNVNEMYQLAEITTAADDTTNTGVLVFSPEHKALLRSVYDNGRQTEHSGLEMMPLAAALMESGLFHHIDDRFNADAYMELMEYAPYLLVDKYLNDDSKKKLYMIIITMNMLWQNNFFIHCTGCAPFVRNESRWIFRDINEFDCFMFEMKI